MITAPTKPSQWIAQRDAKEQERTANGGGVYRFESIFQFENVYI
jgi:hypothetical protein